ncbi:MAG TPA: glycosyltransferase family 2 protein [Chitinophagales bacterium]|jgi:glycosyltransferase involved in cell wall biosynthesis|nr:glycosyltransferase family 2 protein [Chitinophagales bacterium]HQW77904.1 glycosyltransferase family 2 protein [Chitinophagales bacterium]HRB68591.1 glycosyltransferase family 2 protein [Chitinophagales bacterium]
MPRLSILIPVYNAEKFISKTIDSVLAQTYTDWELIIVEDKSTDKSFDVLKQYEAQYPEKIKVFQNEANLGMMLNWNTGIDLCKSELFVKLDADDIWLPTFLEKSIAVLDKYPEVGLVFTKYVNIDEQDNIIPGTEIMLPDFANEQPFSTIPLVQLGQKRMLSYSILRQGLSVMRSNIFEIIGKYQFLITEETQAATDTEFYYRFGMHFNIFCINETLYKYRVHKTSISRLDFENQLSSQKEFELKTAIINYYYKNKKIDELQYKQNINEIIFKHNTFLIQYWIKKKRFAKGFCLFLENFCLAPLNTLSFYKDRLLQR